MLFSFNPRVFAAAVREASLLGSTRSMSNSVARVVTHSDHIVLERLRGEESITVPLPVDVVDLPPEGVAFDWAEIMVLAKTMGRENTPGQASLSPNGDGVTFTVGALSLTLALRADYWLAHRDSLVPVATFDTAVFATALTATQRAISTPAAQTPLLESVNLTIEGTAATMYATDRYRLIRYELPTLQTLTTGPVRLQIPSSKALTHLNKLIPHTLTLEAVLTDDIRAGNIGIRLTGAHGKTLTLRAIPGAYPNVMRLYNEPRTDWFTVNRPALLTILERALTYAKATHGPRSANHLENLTLTLTNGRITATIGPATTAAVVGECPVDQHYEGTFTLNPQYLFDAVDTLTDDTITFRGATAHGALATTKPVSVEGTHTNNPSNLVMPIRG